MGLCVSQSQPLPQSLQTHTNNNYQEECHLALLFAVQVATVPTPQPEGHCNQRGMDHFALISHTVAGTALSGSTSMVGLYILTTPTIATPINRYV